MLSPAHEETIRIFPMTVYSLHLSNSFSVSLLPSFPVKLTDEATDAEFGKALAAFETEVPLVKCKAGCLNHDNGPIR